MEGFKILIVEDKIQSLEALADLFEEELPTSRVDKARSRREALKLIGESHATENPYDLAIVDLLLPVDISGTPADYEATFDKDFFRQMWTERHSTTVLLMSAYGSNPDVQKYFEAVDTLAYNRYKTFPKRENYTFDLLKAGLASLYGDSILKKLRGVFYDREDPGPANPMNSGLTMRFAEIRDDIRKYWRDLDENTKAVVRRYIEVDDSTDPPGVRLA